MDETSSRRAAGAFLGEALGWPGAPEEIGSHLEHVRTEGGETIYAAEIETETDSIPIMVFAYELNDDGIARRGEAVATMMRAGELGTPGPRLVAEAEVDDWGLLLATTPAGLAILTGREDGGVGEAEAENGEPALHPAYSAAMRAHAADALLEALREANARAADLAWILPEPGMGELTVEERALSLFLLDPSSLGDLMHVMRRLVEDASQAAQPK
ncbi:MAG: hypothetical protein ACR2J8_13455 [Thermomicrobiales bacterium]